MFKVLKGSAAAVALALNVIVVFSLMIPASLLKLVVRVRPVRAFADRILNGLATLWIDINSAWMAAVGDTRWDVQGLEGLRPDGWYLVASNHQSWVDILVLQRVFNHRVPFLKFFLKRELIYVPVIGLAWWALDFPFMQRRGGARSADDLERARRACEKFRLVPTSVINFLEGTRFTRAKHDEQGSPFTYLLKPKAGGLATALATLGDRFETLLDVTIVYPDGPPRFWQLLSGELRHVVVRVRQVPIPHEFTDGDYTADRAHRQQIQEWIQGLWADKDRQIGELLGRAPAK